MSSTTSPMAAPPAPPATAATENRTSGMISRPMTTIATTSADTNATPARPTAGPSTARAETGRPAWMSSVAMAIEVVTKIPIGM